MDKLNDVLGLIGKNERIRKKFLVLCNLVEKDMAKIDFNVREEVTAPIIDALHSQLGILKKKIKPDIIFYFRYRSKIARELVMSRDKIPDHVWEPQTTRLGLYFSKNAKHIIIGGAYGGDQAILIANSIKDSNALCHCFEPDREQMEMLKYNAKKNKLKNLVFNPLGLWDEDNKSIVLVGEDSLCYTKIAENQKKEDTFNTITLNSYGKQHSIENIDVIIMDIEGAELSALKGSENYLKQSADKAPKIIFEVHRNYANWDSGLENIEIVKYLVSFGYKIYALRDYQANVPMSEYAIELVELNGSYLKGPPHGFNLVAVKNTNVFQNGLFKICRNISPKLLFHREPSLHYPIHKLK